MLVTLREGLGTVEGRLEAGKRGRQEGVSA